ncbi:hypothetical protein [Yoonia sp. BS5-3]|uniref:DUF4274 domain-containing protein n=1 Tax=Yoonia phaeophyticola TaxID=3137369 RepID=A0ABZ2V162_9RHOB
MTWLAEDDPEGALWAIGELAAEGNLAARDFVRRVYYSVGNGEPRLSRQEFNKLIPEDRDPNADGFGPYPIQSSTIPALDALYAIERELTADEWIAHAEVVIAAGMQSRLLSRVEAVLNNREEIDIEVAGFVQDRLSDDPYFHLLLNRFWGLQLMTFNALAEVEPELVEQRRERWTRVSFPQEIPEPFLEALSGQDWGAMFIEGSLRRWARQVGTAPPFIETSLVGDDVQRLADLVSAGAIATMDDIPPPTDLEFGVLAQSYSQYAERFPSAIPNWTLCERYCPDQPAICAVQAGLLGDLGFSGAYDFSPVLTRREYYQSDRAARTQLAMLGLIEFPQEFKPDWLALPHCLSDPAREAAAALR